MAKKFVSKRSPMTISVDAETADRLRRYAIQLHSSTSQIITDWIWKEPVKDEPVPTEAAK